jgi:hypothetical protein
MWAREVGVNRWNGRPAPASTDIPCRNHWVEIDEGYVQATTRKKKVTTQTRVVIHNNNIPRQRDVAIIIIIIIMRCCRRLGSIKFPPRK